MKKFPILKTQRLILREIRLNDAKTMFQYLSNDILTKYLLLKDIHSIYSTQEIINDYIEKWKFGRGIRWGITKRDTDQLIGTIGFDEWIVEDKRANFSCEISCEFWKHGYGKEAIERIIEYGLNEMGLVRLGALSLPGNKTFIQVLEKLEFCFEGEMRNYVFHNDEPKNVRVYSLIASKYQVAE